MAKKEGFCTQCGSLIQLDDSKASAKCIFCDTEINVANALELNNDLDTRISLQNEAQEKAKTIAKEQLAMNKNTPQVKQKSQKAPISTTHQITVIKPLPTKIKIIMLISVVAFISLIAAILVPFLNARNATRENLDAQISSGFTMIEIDHYSYMYNDNRELRVNTKSEIDEQIAKDAYNAYLEIYKNVYSSEASQATDKLVVKVFAPEGLYLCKYEGSVLACSFQTSTPTATPEPTTAITN